MSWYTHLKAGRKGDVLKLIGIVGMTCLTSCIDPLNIDPGGVQDYLVVQGFINDDFGPHKIRITRVVQFSGSRTGGEVRIVDDAEVNIVDQNGNKTPLKRVSLMKKELIPPRPPTVPCIPRLTFVRIKTDYQTPEDFKGQVGNTYTLEITTKEGATYRSEPQTMLPTPPIDSLLISFKELPSLDPLMPGSGVEVFARWQDPVEEENFYFWHINGIYVIYTPDLGDAIRCCPYDPRDGGEDVCWIVEKNIENNRLAFSDNQVNGQLVTAPVGLIEDDGLRFANREFVLPDKQYYVEVEQYRIPEDAFKFNERANILGIINGEIFDPPPVNIGSNIRNITNPEEIALGYFGAFAKQTASTFIPRSLLKYTQRFPSPCGDCRVRAGAQVEIPEPYRQ